MWTGFEAAMKGVTFAGVLACALMLARPGRWSGYHWLGLAGGALGVMIMAANRALEATLGGLLVDAIYLGLAAAFAVRAWRSPRRAQIATSEPRPGGERRA